MSKVRDSLSALERGEYRRFVVGRTRRKGDRSYSGCAIDARSPEDAMAFADRFYPLRSGEDRVLREIGPAGKDDWFRPAEIGANVPLPAQRDLFSAVIP